MAKDNNNAAENKDQLKTPGGAPVEAVEKKDGFFKKAGAKVGEFKTKHGGIDEYTNNQILNTYTYDTFNGLSPYMHTAKRIFKREGNKNYLYRLTVQRVFSEGV